MSEAFVAPRTRTSQETAPCADSVPREAPEPEASSSPTRVEPAAMPKLFVLISAAAAGGVCNLDGECA